MSIITPPAFELSAQRQAIIAEALSWEGTPYHAQAGVKGVGVDCAMFLVRIAQACGCLAPTWMPPVYSPEWHLHQREELLEQTVLALGGLRIPCPTILPGDIIAFRFGAKAPISHLGIYLPDDRMIHAVWRKQVQRHSLRGHWSRHLSAAYHFPGVV